MIENLAKEEDRFREQLEELEGMKYQLQLLFYDIWDL